MAELTVLIPSRGRPEQARTLVEVFKNTTTADTFLAFVVDDDDPALAEYLTIGDGVRSGVLHGPTRTMVEALNAAAAYVAQTSFAVAFLGDDHMPRTHGWDAAYLGALRDMGSGMVYGNDLLQGRKLPTQIAMTSDIVRALGYMAPPALTHLFVDNFWLDLGRRAGCLRYLPDVTIEHRHPTAGKAKWDEGYKRVNDGTMYAKDEAAYATFVEAEFDDAADRVRMFLPPREWKLFDGDVPFVSTVDFHRDRDRAPHLEQDAHRSRLEAAAEAVATLAVTMGHTTVSDLGCGDGGLLSLVAPTVDEAWGYDFQPSNVDGWAERGVSAEALDVFGNDRDKVRFGDIAVMTEVLEHIADPPGALRWVAASSRFLVASSPRFENDRVHPPEHAWAWNEAGFAKLITDNGWTIRRHELVDATQLVVAEAVR